MAEAKNLLLVEDEPTLQRILGSVLRDRGHAVHGVATAEQALEKIEGGGIDLVLCDKNLPGMNGLDLLTRARSRRPGLGFVLVTGYPSRDSALAVLAHDGDGYMMKPFRSLSAAVDDIERLLGANLPARRAGCSDARRIAQILAGLPSSLAPGLPVAVLVDHDETAARVRGALTRAGAKVVDVGALPPSGAAALVAGRVEDLATFAQRRPGASLVLLDGGASFSDIVALVASGGGAVADHGLLPTEVA